ncbi:MAG: chromosomal replication initiator protein DnaA [Planctomycetota bacterium]|nr:chromosomal replication initiator protein DnaA [Planctomycetota bacterium]
MGSVEPQLWQGLIQHVISHGKDVIRPWFSQLEPAGLEHGQLDILVPGPDEQSYCRQHASRLFAEAAQITTGRLVSVHFSLANEPPAAPAARHEGQYKAVSTLPAKQAGVEPAPTLNDEYTFESFVTGPCNRLATAACAAVAERPGRAYNPLFVHGSAGLGKTHLLQATCRAVLAGGNARISFLSCETFINHLIEAIEVGRLHEFRYRYRSVDVLVIDDVQFLANHDQTQEEFFHTFNTLYQARKQIILSCDRPPAEIPHIEERLISRFNWGLVARVDRPGYETRVAIVHKKAAARDVPLPDDVVCFIAGTVDSNIRELEGAITKIDMLARVLDRPIDVSLAEEALGAKPNGRGGEVTVEQIINAVTKRYGVRLADLQSRKRSRSVSLPRQICMYLARNLTRHSLEEIGGYFGGRDHSTVLHANRTIEGMRKNDVNLRATIEHLTREIQTA